MKKVDFVIREVKFNEDNLYQGVYAISLVKNPAIQLGWEIFADKVPFFRYTASPEPDILPDGSSHKFCKDHSNKVYHISEINNFNRTDEWIPESHYFQKFSGDGNFNIDEQIFFCRHWFKRVQLSEVPKDKVWMMNAENFMKFSIQDNDKHEITGTVMISNKPILRLSVDRGDGTKGPGYVWFSNDTVKKMQEKFGWNRSLTFKHKDIITGSAILLNSWIE